MDPQDKKIIVSRYQDRIAKFGANIKSLASGTELRRMLRFETLSEIGDLEGAKILDLGCGFGDFYDFLRNKGINVDYYGIDIVPEHIKVASTRYPGVNFELRDLEDYPYENQSFDYVFCSQVFNFNLGNNKNITLVHSILNQIFKISRKGIAVDFLTNYVDYEEDHLYYFSPEEIFSYIKKHISKCVTLRHDYGLYEFCIYVRPTFRGWSG